MLTKNAHVRFMNADEVAERLGKSKKWIWHHMDDGTMPPPRVRQPKFTRFLASDIEEWMLAGCPNWKEWKGE